MVCSEIFDPVQRNGNGVKCEGGWSILYLAKTGSAQVRHEKIVFKLGFSGRPRRQEPSPRAAPIVRSNLCYCTPSHA